MDPTRFNDSVSPLSALTARFQAALAAAFGPEFADRDPVIGSSEFGDLQSNVALALARTLRRAPHDVAAAIVNNLDLTGLCSEPEISGRGFINLTLSDEWIATQIQRILADERLAVPVTGSPQRIVVEYSSPNVAKKMHVGHLRPTIVGDALVRVLEHLGHEVVRDNHIGDWGTPFGMLIEHLLDLGEDTAVGEDSSVAHLTTFYREARVKFDTDEPFADRSRQRVVALQAGDPETLRLWRTLVGVSMRYFNSVYERLGVLLTDDDIKGESFYNPWLAETVHLLEEMGLTVISEGALCVFPDGFTGREDRPLPVMIRKSDGGYNYATTDLATIRYRVDTERFDRMIYVVGAAQKQHLQMIFAVARMAGWLPAEVEVQHVAIGDVQGPDGRILKTREGQAALLSDLLDEAEARAEQEFDRVPHEEPFDAAAKAAVVRAVGIGAVKYADLSVSHDSAYVFDLDRMVSFRGDTGPYVQYAAVRPRSIFRKGGLDLESATGPIVIGPKAERALALHLLDFGTVLEQAGANCEPHRLAGYLFGLAKFYTAFHENCPVLTAPDEETRASRLALCAVTLRTLATGLDLLGVPTPERM